MIFNAPFIDHFAWKKCWQKAVEFTVPCFHLKIPTSFPSKNLKFSMERQKGKWVSSMSCHILTTQRTVHPSSVALQGVCCYCQVAPHYIRVTIVCLFNSVIFSFSRNNVIRKSLLSEQAMYMQIKSISNVFKDKNGLSMCVSVYVFCV